MTLVPKPVPIPRPIGAAGAAAALEGTSRLEHSDSHGPSPLGGLQRRWLDYATDRAQHHLCPPSPVEDFGKGWGWMGPVLCQTPQSTGVRLIRRFHGTQGQLGCPSGVIVRGINKLICFFQAPLCKSQATGLKPGCVHSVMDMHSNGIIWRGQSLTGGASTPGASHT